MYAYLLQRRHSVDCYGGEKRLGTGVKLRLPPCETGSDSGGGGEVVTGTARPGGSSCTYKTCSLGHGEEIQGKSSSVAWWKQDCLTL